MKYYERCFPRTIAFEAEMPDHRWGAAAKKMLEQKTPRPLPSIFLAAISGPHSWSPPANGFLSRSTGAAAAGRNFLEFGPGDDVLLQIWVKTDEQCAVAGKLHADLARKLASGNPEKTIEANNRLIAYLVEVTRATLNIGGTWG
ncbi:MAG TPA: hypothetical protein PLI53_00290 [Geobacteraceae bacterium]|nr:hypothetical protein [Geobacteraceae bacterium]